MKASESIPLENMTTADLRQVICLCIGRVLRLGSRPEKSGDGVEYDRVSSIAKEAAEIIRERKGE
jgi:hypothetical protein